jgi:Na+/melibiose symporter-like transporter
MPREMTEQALSRENRRLIALLGLPTLGLALATTVVTTYLPVVARDFIGSTVVIGVIIGLEGLTALWLPLVVGAWSDRLRTRVGGRLPFLLAATPAVVVGLIAIGLIAIGLVKSVAPLAVAALVFFAGYFVAYEPYRALYPDLVGDDAAGRSQGSQELWRGAGTGLAILAGGLLLAIGTFAPFAAAAALYVVAVGSSPGCSSPAAACPTSRVSRRASATSCAPWPSFCASTRRCAPSSPPTRCGSCPWRR